MIPAHERRMLEAHVRKIAFNQLALVTEPLNEYEQHELRELIKLRMKGIPVQYLIGTQDFFGREFYVNSSVLIPRPETEGLVELALKTLPSGDSLNGLDFGTGSGCIALTLKINRPEYQIFANDRSEEALEVARENQKKLSSHLVEFFLTEPIPQLKSFEGYPLFDFIISNPPYLLSSDEIAQDVLEYEPHDALFCQSNHGLFFYQFLADLLEARVAIPGWGFFEVSHDRAEATQQVFIAKGWKCELKKDLTDRYRYLVVTKK